VKLVLLTGEECGLCDEAVAAFNKQFGREIAHEEAEVVNLDADDAWQEKFVENDLPLAPVIVLVTNEGTIVSTVSPEDLLNYKPQAKDIEDLPATPETPPLTNPEQVPTV